MVIQAILILTRAYSGDLRAATSAKYKAGYDCVFSFRHVGGRNVLLRPLRSGSEQYVPAPDTPSGHPIIHVNVFKMYISWKR